MKGHHVSVEVLEHFRGKTYEPTIMWFLGTDELDRTAAKFFAVHHSCLLSLIIFLLSKTMTHISMPFEDAAL